MTEEGIELIRKNALLDVPNKISVESQRRKSSVREQLTQNFQTTRKNPMFFRAYFTAVIIVSVYMLCVRGLPHWNQDPTKKSWWFLLESFINLNFMFEYFYRMFMSSNKLQFLISPANIVDFLSFVPYFSEIYMFSASSPSNTIQILGTLNLLRLIKLLNLGLEYQDVQIFLLAIKSSFRAICFFLVFWVFSSLFFGNLAYYTETSYCTQINGKWFYTEIPAKPCIFQDIGDAIWWSFVTMATVGYGDTVPQTDGGKALAATVMCISVLYLGLPSTIFGANLADLNARVRIEDGSYEDLHVRKKSIFIKDSSDVVSMLQDLEIELSTIKENLANVTEMHRKLILIMKNHQVT